MLSLADVIVRHGQDYLARHGSAVPQGHLRALHAISRGRAQVRGATADCSGLAAAWAVLLQPLRACDSRPRCPPD